MNKEELTRILDEHKGGKRADLSGADLSRASLSRASLFRANLVGADLRWADLSLADLSWANLVGANLRWANLVGADLSWADLIGADLIGADLSGADLSRADLSGADLSRADLSGADLNWCSHALLSEILWRAADTEARQMLAAFVGRKTDWGWEQWVEWPYSEKGWAIGELAQWVKDGDDAPDFIRERAVEIRIEEG